jgi:lipopolysaccharide export system protein LptA
VPAQGFLDALAGPGEAVEMTYGRLADGTGGKMKTTVGENGELSMEINGRVNLDSPRLTLRSNYLKYDAGQEQLLARGDVFLRQPEATVQSEELEFAIDRGVMTLTGDVEVSQEAFTAKSQKLVYDRNVDSFVLTGTPVVEQHTAENEGTFAGMNELQIVRQQNGDVKVQMNGGKEIVCEVKPANGAATKGSAAPAEGAQGGFAGLGSQVKILTRPLGQEQPRVSLSSTEAGGMGQFYAAGSVLLESQDLNLRADQLQYDASGQRLEALRNVVVRQGNIEAECGHLVYDIAANRIELTIDPVVRQKGPTSTMRISDAASIIIKPNPGGTPSLETTELPDRDSKITYIQNEQPGTDQRPTNKEPQEINLQDDADLDKISQ